MTRREAGLSSTCWKHRAKKVAGVDSVERRFVEGYGDHLIVRAFGDAVENNKHILLLGHTDTVHPRGSLADKAVARRMGKIFAPGIFDMKGNCVLMLEVLQCLSENN